MENIQIEELLIVNEIFNFKRASKDYACSWRCKSYFHYKNNGKEYILILHTKRCGNTLMVSGDPFWRTGWEISPFKYVTSIMILECTSGERNYRLVNTIDERSWYRIVNSLELESTPSDCKVTGHYDFLFNSGYSDDPKKAYIYEEIQDVYVKNENNLIIKLLKCDGSDISIEVDIEEESFKKVSN